MRIRRLLSVACAGCMLLGLMGSANAIKLDTMTELSEFAGTTIKVQVIKANFDGNTKDSYIVDVPVPISATKAEAHDLVQAAVGATATTYTTSVETSAAMSLEADGIFEPISTTGITNLGSQIYTYVGGGTLSTTYLSLLVEFWDISTTNASNLQVRVNSSAAPTIDYDTSVGVYNGADVYVVYISGDPYGGGTITMPENATLSVYAKTSSGSLTFNSCDVSASVYDIS